MFCVFLYGLFVSFTAITYSMEIEV